MKTNKININYDKDGLPTYYTILWDPHGTGCYQFYDRCFYITYDVPLDRVDREFVGDLFRNAVVVEVTFKHI